jgi:uncharacterized protein (TIGR02646 family)
VKLVKKSTSPPLLESYVNKNPNSTWEDLKNSRARYNQIAKALKADQRGLCAYCEIDLLEKTSDSTVSDFRVEHFFPKSPHAPPPNWALDWSNMYGSCHGGSQSDVEDSQRFTKPDFCCDVPKSDNDWTNLILDPARDIPAFPIIFNYDESGNIAVGDECPKPLRLKAQGSIDKLCLNARRLTRWREQTIDGMRDSIEALVQEGNEIEDARDIVAQALFSPTGFWPRFFTCARWYLDHSAEKQLQAIAYAG